MFDLDQAIARWRQELTAARIESPAVLDELESHLREEVEKQLQSDQTVQSAFDTAVQQIGKPEALGREFTRAIEASPVRRWNWLVAACFAFPILCLGRRALVLTKLYGFWYQNWTMPERVLGGAAIAMLLLAVCSWSFSYRFLPVIADRRKRMAAILACTAAGPLWFQFVPQFFLPLQPATGQFIVTMLWLMVPCVVLVGAIYGLERAARRVVAADS